MMGQERLAPSGMAVYMTWGRSSSRMRTSTRATSMMGGPASMVSSDISSVYAFLMASSKAGSTEVNSSAARGMVMASSDGMTARSSMGNGKRTREFKERCASKMAL